MTSPDFNTPEIRHVVLLLLENRSFDQMLGGLKSAFPELDGVDANHPSSNLDDRGKVFAQAPMTARQMLKWDPHHEVEHVSAQLANHNGGFVLDFCQAYPDSTDQARSFIMGYYPPGFLPALHRLAREFTICDRWFSSLPGPTWPNRFFALSGTCNGRVDMPGDGRHGLDLSGFLAQTQVTLFDRLNDRAVHWKAYFHDIPQSAVLKSQRDPHNAARYFYVDEFFKDARGPEGDFPQFAFVEPDYMGFQQNDAHPPHDVMKSEKLISDVYNAIRSNDRLWQSTLLIVTYDEHGGFFDHVEPPTAIPPDDIECGACDFNRLGVRVPALLISPWVSRRVLSEQFDHTSILRYLTDKWGLGPLGRRTAAANSIGVAIDQTAPRQDTTARLELAEDELNPPDPKVEDDAFGIVNSHQTALKRFADYLQKEAVTKSPIYWFCLSRVIMFVQAKLQWLLDRALDEPVQFVASIADPDKLSHVSDKSAKDKVAKFIMRMKRYAAVGIANHLDKESLSDELRRHSLHTLALITDRNFHKEEATERVANAKAWLARQEK